MVSASTDRLNIAVIGSGISGMSAAWLLSRDHTVTLFEQDGRVGGHSNTVDAPSPHGPIPIDTGFIVYNEVTYPNLAALFEHLGVRTAPSEMSFAVSLGGGHFEYSGGSLSGLLAQRRNLVRPRFWSMMRDLMRFYREAPAHLAGVSKSQLSLGDYLDAGGYGQAFRNDHLLPMAAAIWSAPTRSILDYPAASFIRFHENHGLLQVRDRPQWRTVEGGSRSYVDLLTKSYADRIRLNAGVASIHRSAGHVEIVDHQGNRATFDRVLIATHADQALALLDDPSDHERRLLGAFRYSVNRAVLHSDLSLMPRRRAVWASWNFIERDQSIVRPPTVTYWMNRLQPIARQPDLFVTLNPDREPQQILHHEVYDHPLFDQRAIAAQNELWTLQGHRNTWYCGAYFGAGFHEDGLQAGLAAAESLGGVRRPWDVENESGRIVLGPNAPIPAREELAA